MCNQEIVIRQLIAKLVLFLTDLSFSHFEQNELRAVKNFLEIDQEHELRVEYLGEMS